jgi:hypothetical protein
MAGNINISMTYNHLARLARDFSIETDKIVQETADALKAEMVERMQEPKSGRVYRNHVASAPGEAPAVDSGNLSGQIQKRKMGPSKASVTINTDYGIALEYGSRRKKSGRLAKRPFVRPSVKKIFPKMIEMLKDLERRVR